MTSPNRFLRATGAEEKPAGGGSQPGADRDLQRGRVRAGADGGDEEGGGRDGRHHLRVRAAAARERKQKRRKKIVTPCVLALATRRVAPFVAEFCSSSAAAAAAAAAVVVVVVVIWRRTPATRSCLLPEMSSSSSSSSSFFGSACLRVNTAFAPCCPAARSACRESRVTWPKRGWLSHTRKRSMRRLRSAAATRRAIVLARRRSV